MDPAAATNPQAIMQLLSALASGSTLMIVLAIWWYTHQLQTLALKELRSALSILSDAVKRASGCEELAREVHESYTSQAEVSTRTIEILTKLHDAVCSNQFCPVIKDLNGVGVNICSTVMERAVDRRGGGRP